MPNPVPERPHLPVPSTKDHGTNSWGLSIVSTLLELFQQIGYRLNGSIHKDGGVCMEAPLCLGPYTTATRPAAADHEGSLIYVSDADEGEKFQGSNGTEWLALDGSGTGGGGIGAYEDAVLADTPLAYWRFGESSGTAAADSSGNGNNASYQGTFTLEATGLVAGDADTAVNMEGTSYVDGLVDTGGVAAVSFEFILGPVTGSGEQRVYDWQDSSGFFIARVNSPSAGRLAVLCQTGSNVEVDVAINLAEAHHVAVTQLESGNLNLYVDGVLAATDGLGASFSGTGTARRIGSTRNSTATRLNAVLDEFAVYASELSVGRIEAHAEAAGYYTP